jgi:quinol monooxygenase YgiN
MYAIFVTIKVKPGFAEKFKEASLGDAQGSVRDESGCLRFDMHQSTTDPNTFHLYEVYENQDAHVNALHQLYPLYRATVRAAQGLSLHRGPLGNARRRRLTSSAARVSASSIRRLKGKW